MTVTELIDQLIKLPPDATVCVFDHQNVVHDRVEIQGPWSTRDVIPYVESLTAEIGPFICIMEQD